MSEEKVIIQDSKPAVKEEKVYETEGLDEKEVKSAKEHGFIKDDKKKEDKKKEEAKKQKDDDDWDEDDSDDKPKEKKDDEKQIDPSTFDEMDESFKKDQGKFHKNFSANAKALYFKFKRNRQLRQDAESAREKAEKDRDFLAIQEKSRLKQLAEINDILDRIDAGDDKITTADIRKAIAFKKEEKQREEEDAGTDKKEDKKPSPEEQKKHQEYLQEKSKNSELLGKSKYEDFDRYVELANEIVAKDKDMAAMVTRAFNDPEVDEEQLMEKIVRVARMHEDFYNKPEDKEEDVKKEKVEKKDSKEIDRMVANANKKKTSASLTGGSGRREVSFDDLTLEDVSKMNRAQYDKLPKAVRERILRES